MSDLTDRFDLFISGVLTQDVADSLRCLRSQGLLGAFLSQPEVLGDQPVDFLSLGWAEEICFCQDASRLNNGNGFVWSAEGDCVSLTPLSPSKPPDPAV